MKCAFPKRKHISKYYLTFCVLAVADIGSGFANKVKAAYIAVFRADKSITTTACPYPSFPSFFVFFQRWKTMKFCSNTAFRLQSNWITRITITSSPSASFNHFDFVCSLCPKLLCFKSKYKKVGILPIRIV